MADIRPSSNASEVRADFPGIDGLTIDPVRPVPVRRTAAEPRRTQQERRAEAESRLLDAARTLLSRKGWVGMTLAEVGETAGYSRGLAAHHFGNKATLLRALIAHLVSAFAKEMASAPPSPPGLQAVLVYVRVYLGRADPEWTNARSILLLLSEALLENSDTAEIVIRNNRSMFSWLEDNLRIGIEQGEVRPDVDPALGAELVIGTMRGFAQQRLVQNRESSLRDDKEKVVKYIEQMFAIPRKHRKHAGESNEL